MAVTKYKDPKTGKVEIVGAPKQATRYITASMLASKWNGNQYSFEEEYPHAEYDTEIQVAPTATAEQFEAFGGAMICGSHNSNVATAVGDVPSVDIPIIIKAVRK